jgi:superfamily II DNA/RNA helicase
MAESVEAIQARIREAVAPGFRGRLLARGQARSMLWREGVLPEGAPTFSALLTHDLLSYGYSLLSHGLRLLEQKGDEDTARIAFEHAGEAIESVIANGPLNEDRHFHGIVAAATYHLGRFSARAYSLIQQSLVGGNLAPPEKLLAALMVRDLEGINSQIDSWRLNGRATDQALVGALSGAYGDESLRLAAPPAEDNDDAGDALVDTVVLALADNFMAATAIAMLAFDRGEERLISHAVEKLSIGLVAAGEINLVPQWWAYRLAIHLIQDLWSTSYHCRLPRGPSGADVTEWGRLRDLFIASIYRRSKSEIELWPSQLDAVARATESNDNLVVSLPTSAGKTRIAEICILACLASGRRVVYVTPLRALSAQTEVSLRHTFYPLGKTVSSLYGSIGVDDVDVDVLRARDIVVTTPEKLDFALRSDASLLDDVGLVILDEGHMIGLGEREVRYEIQIQRLLMRSDASERRIVCLSAILPEGKQLEDFVAWLTRDTPTGLVKNPWRPTRLRFGEIVWQGNRARLNISIGEETPFVPRFLTASVPPVGRRRTPFPADQRELCLASAWRLIEDGHTVLIFCPLRRSVEPFAKAIVDLNTRGVLRNVLENAVSIERAVAIGQEWFGEQHPILDCLKLGVAIHHGALPSPFRKEVERLLRDGVIKVTVSSPTLAQGLNLTATSLIFHGLKRGRDQIQNSEFRNVVGRAGRAFIDLEGLVLYPMYDKVKERRAEWNALIANDHGRELESGLIKLVGTLMMRMQSKLGTKDIAPLLEYVANNAAWHFPVDATERPQDAAAEELRWNDHIALLDTAILSLIGELHIPDDQVETTLDAVLHSSLWERRIARRTEPTRRALKAGLAARARYVWANSTATQRRGYFHAGVGFDTGRRLDIEAGRLGNLLIQANEAIHHNQQENAILRIIEIAEIVFGISPFIPDVKPEKWRELLADWLRGLPVSGNASDENSAHLQFVEGALSYKLPWAMEAVRVRGLASDERFEGVLSLADYDLGPAVAAVETGTLHRSAQLLLRTGFDLRLMAIRIVRDTDAKFKTVAELRSWLQSPPIVSLTSDSNWPSPTAHSLWQLYVQSLEPQPKSVWRHVADTVNVNWFEGVPPPPGAPLRLTNNFLPLIMSADCSSIGVFDRSINTDHGGLVTATVGSSSDTVLMNYLGPRHLFASVT